MLRIDSEDIRNCITESFINAHVTHKEGLTALQLKRLAKGETITDPSDEARRICSELSSYLDSCTSGWLDINDEHPYSITKNTSTGQWSLSVWWMDSPKKDVVVTGTLYDCFNYVDDYWEKQDPDNVF